jgi:HAD superfamily hydrolase (TIGR01549 family)
MAKAIFFDLWNTILFCPTRKKVGEMAAVLGLEGKAGYREIIEGMEATTFVDATHTPERLLAELCARHGVDAAPERVKAAAGIWRSRLDEAGYFPEAAEALADLGRDYRLGLISNTDKGGADYVMEKDVGRHFSVAVMSCYAGCAKPDPKIFLMALEEMGFEPGDCWMVGDHIDIDVEGAANAGMNAALIDRRGEHGWDGRTVIASLLEVRGAVEGGDKAIKPRSRNNRHPKR